MTGLEKMKSQILDEANSSAKELLDRASKEAQAMKQKMKEKAEEKCGHISQKAKADVAGYQERVASSCDLQKRKAVLAAKQEVIADMLDKAYQTLLNADDETYFSMVRKMLEKFVLAQEGEICFSANDLKRMPTGFEKGISDIAEKNGGKLILSKEERNISSGFVLIYGGIEENCTFKALFDSKKDELSDKVHALLFS